MPGSPCLHGNKRTVLKLSTVFLFTLRSSEDPGMAFSAAGTQLNLKMDLLFVYPVFLQ